MNDEEVKEENGQESSETTGSEPVEVGEATGTDPVAEDKEVI